MEKMPKILVSILIPVKDERENLPVLRERLSQVLDKFDQQEYEFELLINDNGSKDGSSELIQEWAVEDLRVNALIIGKDLGFQGSLILGFRRAKGDCLIVLQSDLQDPPEIIPRMIEKWQNGAMIVAGIIDSRKETRLDRFSRKLFYKLLHKTTFTHVEEQLQDFYLLDKAIYRELRSLPFEDSFIRSEITRNFSVGAKIFYDRDARIHGKSKFTFAEKTKLAIEGFLFGGDKARVFLIILSTIVICVSALFLILILILPVLGIQYEVKGWLSLVLIQIFAMGFNALIALAILEFVTRNYRHTIAVERMQIKLEQKDQGIKSQ